MVSGEFSSHVRPVTKMRRERDQFVHEIQLRKCMRKMPQNQTRLSALSLIFRGHYCNGFSYSLQIFFTCKNWRSLECFLCMSLAHTVLVSSFFFPLTRPIQGLPLPSLMIHCLPIIDAIFLGSLMLIVITYYTCIADCSKCEMSPVITWCSFDPPVFESAQKIEKTWCKWKIGQHSRRKISKKIYLLFLLCLLGFDLLKNFLKALLWNEENKK